MTLLTVLRSEAQGSSTCAHGASGTDSYSVNVNYLLPSLAVTGLAWTISGGSLTLSVTSGAMPAHQEVALTGSGSTLLQTGFFYDQSFNANVTWST